MANPLTARAEPIPGYRLLEFLGRGGFGEVWKAEAPGGLHKAIKIVYGNLDAIGPDGGSVSQELKALSRVKAVRHPYILSLERYDIIDGQLFIVMELADCNLEARFQQCRAQGLPGIPRAELLHYMEEAAEALDLMNVQHQLQHLDIKPQNLFLVGNHVKVADFGLVKDLEGMAASLTGGVTPVYAAPETFEHTVSRFCDQYSLAIVYQELLTGQRPFAGGNPRQLLFQHLNTPPDLTALPASDRDAIARALAKKPTDRYPSCQHLLQVLRGQASTVVEPGRGVPPLPESSVFELPGVRETPAPALLPSSGSTLRVPRTDSPRSAETSSRLFPPPVRAAAEQTGDGVLAPALIVGLGGFGRAALHRLRAALIARFGSVEAVPHIRLLGLDTEPEPESDRPSGAEPERATDLLTGREMLFTRLGRPNHYLRARGTAMPLVGWIDPQVICRIPRNLATAGTRALGRLAFFDHCGEIVQRLQAELTACTTLPALEKAARDTGLGMRSNRPRVYVVTSLAGGTGSGMFLDLAYTARTLLHRLGYPGAAVVGLLHLPPTTPGGASDQALANTVAALTELHHYGSPGVTFTALYQAEDEPVADAAPPFSPCVLLPQEDRGEPAARTAAHAAGFLLGELLSPLGRSADTWRAARQTAAARPSCHSFGSFRVAWPRAILVRRAGRRLCRFLVRAWAERGGSGTAATLRAWVADQWAGKQWESFDWAARIEEACNRELGRPAEEGFAEITEPAAAALEGGRADKNTGPAALERLENLIGRPDGVTIDHLPLGVGDVVERAAEQVLAAAQPALVDLTLGLLEEPQFRLAGAEEAVRQFADLLRHKVAQQEALCTKLDGETRQIHQRLRSLLREIAGGSSWFRFLGGNGPHAEAVELLRLYPRFRHQYLIHRGVLRVYQGLLADCPQLLHEVSLCRGQLHDLAQTLEARVPGRHEIDVGPGCTLLPAGTDSSRDAVSKTLQGLTRDDVLHFDRTVQAALGESFAGLRAWCRSKAYSLKDMEAALQKEAERFVEERLAGMDALAVFLERHESEQRAADELAAAFDEAVPAAAGSPDELALLTIPAAADSGRIRELLGQLLPQLQLVAAPGTDELIVYRERSGVEIGRLPQMGAAARAAYERVRAVECGNPHSRGDVSAWLPVT